MVQICNRIYVKDLCITDITSPGSKRVRRQAKYLANFILYATNKETDLKDQISEIQDRVKLLQDLLGEKDKVLQAVKDKALHIAKQLSLKDAYTAEIQKLQAKLEKNNKIHVELMARMTAAEERKQEAMELCGTYKAQTLKLSKTIAELQSQIVKSPEEYQMQLNELEQQQSAKVKEREAMQEAFQDKKHLIEQQTNILAFIQEQLEKFTEVQDIHDRLKKISIQDDSAKKQIDILKTDVTEFEKRLDFQKDQNKEYKIDVIHAQCEERLSSLRNLRTQLLNNKKLCKEKFEKELDQQNEYSLKVEKMQSMIKKLEEETVALLKTYQDLYDKEILTEKTLWETSNE
ncbi:unnamed protein product [Xylocopa violacea]